MTNTSFLSRLLVLGLGASPLAINLARANTALDVKNGQANLLVAGSYVQNTAPTATDDVRFLSATTYSPVTFTISGNNTLSIGTLNDFDATQSLTIQNGTAATVATLTLNGGANSLAPSANDLLYVASGGTLTVQNGTGTLNMTLGSAGNLNIAGIANLSSSITSAVGLVTKTGAGTLNLTGSNSGLSSGFTVAAGQVNINNANSLGANANAVTLGTGAESATINTTAGFTAVQNITVASGGTRGIKSSSASTSNLNGSIALNGDLNVANSAGGSLRFGGTVSGSRNIIVDSTNTGEVRFTAANAGYSGTTFVNSGAVVVGNSSALGTGAIVLGDTGGSANTSLTGFGGGTIANAGGITVRSGNSGTTTISNLNGQSIVWSSAVTLQKDVTLRFDTSGLNRFNSSFSGTGNINILVSGVSANGLQFGDGASAGGVINNVGTITVSGNSTGSSPVVFQAGSSIGANVTSLIQNSASNGIFLNAANPNFAGSVVINSGSVVVANSGSALGAANVVSVGSGGTFDVRNLDLTIAGLNDVAGAGGTVTQTTGTPRTLTLGGSGNYAFSGSITATTPANRSLALIGTGTQTLSGNNNYGGTTTVAAGTLLVNGGHTGGGAYSVGAAGTLGGSGSIGATSVTIANGGRLTPGGAGIEDLSFALSGTMNLSAMNTDGAMLFNLDTAAGSDRIVLTAGTLNVGTLDFTEFSFATGVNFGPGNYILFDASSAIAGSIGIASGSIGSYTATLSIDAINNDVVLNVVPEPGAAMLFGTGLGVLLWRQRRRHHHS